MATATTVLLPEVVEALAPRLAPLTTRQEMVREAAATLFFGHGIYPSAKTVLAYIKHGSMSDINNDLREFWSELREKSRIKIEAPMFPDAVNALFCNALAKVWELAMDKANAALDGERQEAADLVAQAERKAEDADRKRLIAESDAAECESEMRQERERRESADQKIEAQAAEIGVLQSSLAKWQSQAESEAKARQEAEKQFSADLGAERAANQRNIEILDGEVKFVKMQIEVARSTERDLRDQLKEEKANKEIELAAYRQRANRAEEELGTTRIELAGIKGRFEGIENRNTELQERLKGLAKRTQNSGVKPIAKRRSLRR